MTPLSEMRTTGSASSPIRVGWWLQPELQSSLRVRPREGRAGPGLEGEGQVMIQLGQTAPDFMAETTQGLIRFDDWLGSAWGVLFSHPKEFTPVCTTELGETARLKPEFDRRGVKVIGLSGDPLDR